jgi:hypothetical protein
VLIFIASIFKFRGYTANGSKEAYGGGISSTASFQTNETAILFPKEFLAVRRVWKGEPQHRIIYETKK